MCTPGGPVETDVTFKSPGGAMHGLNSVAREFNTSATMVVNLGMTNV